MTKQTSGVAVSKFACLHWYSCEVSPRLFRFKGGHINNEAVLHIGLEQALVGFVDLLDRDDFDICGDVVLTAKIEHFLSLGDAANI